MASGFILIGCIRLIAHNVCFILDCHSFSTNRFEMPRRLLNVRCRATRFFNCKEYTQPMLRINSTNKKNKTKNKRTNKMDR